jgi:predicted kinase
MTARTYARLTAAAGHALEGGFSVIVDAACLRRAERDALRAVASARRAPFRLLAVTAPRELLEARLDARAAAGDDASEATRDVLALQLGVAEPLADAERSGAIDVDGSAPGDAARIATALRGAGGSGS